jgi:tetratricopeptide (TPR) repeat protein
VIAVACARAACAVGALLDFEGARSLIARATAIVGVDEMGARFLRYASAKIAFWEGDWGALVENLSTTVLPADTRERVAMLLILATAVVSVDGREALARGLEYVARAEALVVRSADDPVAEVNCSKARLLCFFFAGEFHRAAETAEEAVALSRKAGLRYEEGMHLHNLGEFSLRIGMQARSRAALVASNVIAQDLELETVKHHNDMIIAFIDQDVARFERLVEEARSAGNAWKEMHTRYWFARTLGASGNAGARREYGRALALARELKVRGIADECALAIAALPPERQSTFPKGSDV